jgi:hypothetical protein
MLAMVAALTRCGGGPSGPPAVPTTPFFDASNMSTGAPVNGFFPVGATSAFVASDVILGFGAPADIGTGSNGAVLVLGLNGSLSFGMPLNPGETAGFSLETSDPSTTSFSVSVGTIQISASNGNVTVNGTLLASMGANRVLRLFVGAGGVTAVTGGTTNSVPATVPTGAVTFSLTNTGASQLRFNSLAVTGSTPVSIVSISPSDATTANVGEPITLSVTTQGGLNPTNSWLKVGNGTSAWNVNGTGQWTADSQAYSLTTSDGTPTTVSLGLAPTATDTVGCEVVFPSGGTCSVALTSGGAPILGLLASPGSPVLQCYTPQGLVGTPIPNPPGSPVDVAMAPHRPGGIGQVLVTINGEPAALVSPPLDPSLPIDGVQFAATSPAPGSAVTLAVNGLGVLGAGGSASLITVPAMQTLPAGSLASQFVRGFVPMAAPGTTTIQVTEQQSGPQVYAVHVKGAEDSGTFQLFPPVSWANPATTELATKQDSRGTILSSASATFAFMDNQVFGPSGAFALPPGVDAYLQMNGSSPLGTVLTTNGSLKSIAEAGFTAFTDTAEAGSTGASFVTNVNVSGFSGGSATVTVVPGNGTSVVKFRGLGFSLGSVQVSGVFDQISAGDDGGAPGQAVGVIILRNSTSGATETFKVGGVANAYTLTPIAGAPTTTIAVGCGPSGPLYLAGSPASIVNDLSETVCVVPADTRVFAAVNAQRTPTGATTYQLAVFPSGEVIDPGAGLVVGGVVIGDNTVATSDAAHVEEATGNLTVDHTPVASSASLAVKGGDSVTVNETPSGSCTLRATSRGPAAVTFGGANRTGFPSDNLNVKSDLDVAHLDATTAASGFLAAAASGGKGATTQVNPATLAALQSAIAALRTKLGTQESSCANVVYGGGAGLSLGSKVTAPANGASQLKSMTLTGNDGGRSFNAQFLNGAPPNNGIPGNGVLVAKSDGPGTDRAHLAAWLAKADSDLTISQMRLAGFTFGYNPRLDARYDFDIDHTSATDQNTWQIQLTFTSSLNANQFAIFAVPPNQGTGGGSGSLTIDYSLTRAGSTTTLFHQQMAGTYDSVLATMNQGALFRAPVTAFGSYNWTMSITAGLGGSIRYQFSPGPGHEDADCSSTIISITPASSTLPSGTVGAAYSEALAAAGGLAGLPPAPAYGWSVTSATALPPGLALDAGTGVISGTPTASGSFPFQVTATDSLGCAGHRSYTITVVAPAKETPTITWPNPADTTYGTALGSTQLDATASDPVTSAPVAGSFTYSPAAGTVLGAGSGQTVTVSFTPDDTTSYTGATAQATINVTSAPLTVQANDATRLQGAANPAFTGTITGAVNGDVITATYAAPSVTPASPAGTYTNAIVPTPAGAALANYAVTLIDGTLTVLAPATDVTSQVAIVRGGFHYASATRRWQQSVTITNASAAAIVGPISLVLDNLSVNATLLNASGTTQWLVPLGSPYVNAANGLAPGGSVTLGLQFADPTNAAITYTTRVLAGPGAH